MSTPKKRSMTPSWDLYITNLSYVKTHYVAIMYLVLLPGLVGLLGTLLTGDISSIVNDQTFTDRQILGSILTLLGFTWTVVNLGPLTHYVLSSLKKKPLSLKAAYVEGLPFTFRLLAYYVLFGLAVIGGLLLLIVPGLIVIRRYFLADYYLVDKKLSIRQAFTQSSAVSKPYSRAIWGTVGVLFALSFAAAITESLLPPIGLVLAQLITCSYVYLKALRYREIEA